MSLDHNTHKACCKALSAMGPQRVVILSMAATAVKAAQYSLQAASIEANQPFSEAFVSYSIEFSSFPDFAGEHNPPDMAKSARAVHRDQYT